MKAYIDDVIKMHTVTIHFVDGEKINVNSIIDYIDTDPNSIVLGDGKNSYFVNISNVNYISVTLVHTTQKISC